MCGTCTHIRILVLDNADEWEAALLADAIVPLLMNAELWEVRSREEGLLAGGAKRRREAFAHGMLTLLTTSSLALLARVIRLRLTFRVCVCAFACSCVKNLCSARI